MLITELSDQLSVTGIDHGVGLSAEASGVHIRQDVVDTLPCFYVKRTKPYKAVYHAHQEKHACYPEKSFKYFPFLYVPDCLLVFFCHFPPCVCAGSVRTEVLETVFVTIQQGAKRLCMMLSSYLCFRTARVQRTVRIGGVTSDERLPPFYYYTMDVKFL